MPLPDLRRLPPGQSPSAGDWNSLVEHLLTTQGTAFGAAFGDAGVSRIGMGLAVLDGSPKPHWGKVTARGTGNNYTHLQAVPRGDGTFIDLPLTGDYIWGSYTAGLPAREVNGRTDFDSLLPFYTLLWPDPDGPGYLFDRQGGSDSVFPAELTSTYSAGYSWKRKTVTSGTWADYSPAQTGTNNAFSPDNNQTFPIGTRGVIVRDGARYAFIPVVLYRQHCVAGVWWRQRSLDGGATWTDVESTGVSCSTVPKPAGCDPSGWAWVAGLLWIDDPAGDPVEFQECLKLTVLSASGFCAGIDDGQELYLRTADGVTWTSQEWDCEAVPPDWADADFLCDPDAGPAVFTIDPATGMPTLKLCGKTRALTPTCGGQGVVVFTGGGTAFCDGAVPAEACLDNTFVVQVECVCCPIDGWDGPGWYCVLDEGDDCGGEGATTVVVELLEEDRCDANIVICSCRFGTEGEAEAWCGPPVDNDCCTGVPRVLRFDLTSVTGDCGCLPAGGLMYYHEADGVWYSYPEGGSSGGFDCGAGSCYLKLECAGSSWTCAVASCAELETPVSASCSPFQVVFDVENFGVNCTGTFRVTFTPA